MKACCHDRKDLLPGAWNESQKRRSFITSYETSQQELLMEPWEWTETQQRTFKALKRASVSAAVLALPDITNSFHLYTDEAWGI